MNEPPCRPDHNGECLVCDCWPSECAWRRLMAGDFRQETLDELLVTFKDHLTATQTAELRDKFPQMSS